MAAGVVAFFEDVMARITLLAVFLPVVAGQGGNAGAQSLAVVMRGIVIHEIPKDRIEPLILKEGGLAFSRPDLYFENSLIYHYDLCNFSQMQ